MKQKTGIKQQAISRLENPYYGKATLTTLKKFAAANDVGLLVEFVPYSELINRVSGTPYVERGFSPQTMNIPSFEEEETRGVFEDQPVPPAPQQQISSGRSSASLYLPSDFQGDDSGMITMFFHSHGDGDETVPMIPVPDSASGLGAEGPHASTGRVIYGR